MNAPKIDNEEGKGMEDVITIDVSTDRVALYNPIEAGLAEMENRYKEGPKDLSVPSHYEECRLALSETRGIRGKTEKLRKELKADALAYGRLVDSTAKRIIDKVLAIEEPYAVAKKEFDTRIEIEKREKALAEERRVDGIASRIAEIAGLVGVHVSSTSSDILALYPHLNDSLDTCNEWAMEFSDKAKAALVETLAKLEELHSMKVQQEQYAADKAKAEKEAEEKAKADRIQREKESAEERERLAKERAALEAERSAMQAERDKLAVLQAEKDRIAAEEQAERDRVAKAEQAEKERLFDLERKKMAAEIESLKGDSSASKPQPASEIKKTTVDQPVSTGITESYKDSGRAIMAITKSKEMAKTLLNAIINGSIPNIQYTGEV